MYVYEPERTELLLALLKFLCSKLCHLDILGSLHINLQAENKVYYFTVINKS